jgi:hypothetical protein
MKLNVIAVSSLCLALTGVAMAQTANSSAKDGTQYTQAQAKQMAREAHTPEQYGALAGYYASRQRSYELKAADEKQEWARRSQNIMLTAAKYPRPVDSARNLYEYYSYEAAESGKLAAKYGQLAAPAQVPGVK